ncbi:hypothetical protein Pmani_032151 [Petrolisthes manimaculis]|uniref:X-box-binding protein 1 n=1 Tax=Petrolisthes manimaculis TaxID=1843537 RepID=A0AAE1NTV9_9EUCA|nr:hypothetical protein Pmani_032151 [Petrolisthes manimaculis]
MTNNEDEMDKPPRKRQKLDHLTMEEKLMRRKLKNRVAAQTARDRKKVRMDQLEAQLADLKEHIKELTTLTTILSDQNTHLTEENAELEEKLERCTCAEGSRSVGSNQDHGALYTLLPMDKSGCNDRRHVQNSEPVVRQVFPQQQQTTASTQLTSQEASSYQQVVGTTPTVMEPNWDIDHDYTSESLPVDCSLRLTPDEENLITELTSALSEVPVSGMGQASTNGIISSQTDTVTHTTGDVCTPDIMKDFFDFGMDVNVVGHEDNHRLVKVESETHNKANSQAPSSPISKEQILDFLEGKTLSSPQYGSESGYESSLSPRSLGSSEELDDQGMELDSFIELFPSLF